MFFKNRCFWHPYGVFCWCWCVVQISGRNTLENVFQITSQGKFSTQNVEIPYHLHPALSYNLSYSLLLGSNVGKFVWAFLWPKVFKSRENVILFLLDWFSGFRVPRDETMQNHLEIWWKSQFGITYVFRTAFFSKIVVFNLQTTIFDGKTVFFKFLAEIRLRTPIKSPQEASSRPKTCKFRTTCTLP